jgi:CDP-diacylglycerol--glycerol-3-phosphate 3-phosphatidyltransferase
VAEQVGTWFGPSALATPANAVTAARVLITPVLLLLILGVGPSWPALVLWVALASTDGVDGYIARRQGTTRSGAFLDPLADKLLVLGALWALVVEGGLWWLPVALITLREVAMSAYRSWVGRRGTSIPARGTAKLKTVVQAVAVGVALCPPLARDATWLVSSVLWAAVVLTVVSGYQYLRDGRAAAAGARR